MINIEENTGKPEEGQPEGNPEGQSQEGKPEGKPQEGKPDEGKPQEGKPEEGKIKIVIEGNIEKQLTNEPINKEQGSMPAAAMAAGKKR